MPETTNTTVITIDTVSSLRRWLRSVSKVYVRTQLNGDSEFEWYAPAMKGAFAEQLESFDPATPVHAELRGNNELYVG